MLDFSKLGTCYVVRYRALRALASSDLEQVGFDTRHEAQAFIYSIKRIASHSEMIQMPLSTYRQLKRA